jgi:hypothetical protein
MSLRPLKFIVQAVVLEENENEIVGERVSEPQTFYGADALKEWVDRFQMELQMQDDGKVEERT